ncbi:YdiY family protein [Planctomycetota bacterium]
MAQAWSRGELRAGVVWAYLLCFCIFGVSGVVAAEMKEPPEPTTDKFDWIRFNNGEWLKGEIEDLQDDDFTFDSDELDSLNIDWEDIYAVYSPRYNTFVLEDRTVLQGRLRIVGDRVFVITTEGEKEISRSELRAIIPGELRERNFWSMKFSLGMTARQGNTEQTDFATYLFLQRRSPRKRTHLDYAGNYSSVEGQETTNNHNTNLSHDIFVTRQLYATLPSLQYYRDKFMNIANRLTPGLGMGYAIIDRGKMEWSVGGGAGYQATRYYSVEPGEDPSEETAVILANTDFNYDITKKIEFDLHYKLSVGISGRRSNDHHVLAMFSFELWKDLDLDLSLTWDRIGNPKPREDGSLPKNDDLRTFVGIGWEF